MTMDLSENWADYLSSLDNVYIFVSEQEHGMLVTFVSEVRCRDAVAAHRQPTLDLWWAQHQRRGLGFDG